MTLSSGEQEMSGDKRREEKTWSGDGASKRPACASRGREARREAKREDTFSEDIGRFAERRDVRRSGRTPVLERSSCKERRGEERRGEERRGEERRGEERRGEERREERRGEERRGEERRGEEID